VRGDEGADHLAGKDIVESGQSMDRFGILHNVREASWTNDSESTHRVLGCDTKA
jgi:hypothetical protein